MICHSNFLPEADLDAVQASTVAAGVSAYLIKTDMSKLGPAEMAQYFEERLGWAVTTAWNLTVKDVEQTISGVCQQVGRKFLLTACRNGMCACLPVYSAVYCRQLNICKFAYTSTQQMRPVYVLQIQDCLDMQCFHYTQHFLY